MGFDSGFGGIFFSDPEKWDWDIGKLPLAADRRRCAIKLWFELRLFGRGKGRTLTKHGLSSRKYRRDYVFMYGRHLLMVEI